MKPKVSVVITTYNRPKTLKRAVESILEQDFKNFELIIVDDRSDKKVDPPSDPRIRYLRNETNRGGTYSLNRGLREAKGEYICPLDDDDEWIDSEKLSKQIVFLENHPDFSVVGTNAKVRLLDEHGKLMKELTTNVPLSDGEIRDRMLLANSVAHVTSMYRRRAALAVGGYDGSLERGKDWDLFLKLGRVGRLGNIKDVCARFDEKRGVGLKLRDSAAKIRVIRRHADYPHFFRAFFTENVRYLIFEFLFKAGY